MDKDYQNFVDRMGSFEDNIDLNEDNLGVYHNSIVTRNRGALTTDELKHFGKLGMKWGHHKAVNATTIGATARTGKEITSLGQTINKTSFNKKSVKEAKSLSDDDLKKLTTRLNLENNYINAKQQQSGRSKVESILSVAGGTLAVASSAAILYDTVRKFK